MLNKTKMINSDDYSNGNKTEHNLKWLFIQDHLHRILIKADSRSGKTNALLDLINNQLMLKINNQRMLEIHMKQNVNI